METALPIPVKIVISINLMAETLPQDPVVSKRGQAVKQQIDTINVVNMSDSTILNVQTGYYLNDELDG